MFRPELFSSALVVESDPAVACRMRRILGALAPGRQVLLAPTHAQADALLAIVRFDLVFVDIQLHPQGDGARLIAQVRAAQPRAQVVAMSDMDNHDLVLHAFAAGATGYLLSEAEDAEIAHALRALQRDGAALDSRVARRVLGMLAASLQPGAHLPPGPGPATPAAQCALKPRELQFLRLVASGLSNRQIAHTLALSIHTVDFHAKNTYRKLDVRSRTQAILEATRHGLLG
ncbi:MULTISPECIES: LuxR C-terminal-related transcriptional regulator [unclassified Variovorax]|uniref:LuxR C-terminal-related transcriptional regulator n=1 Tax=unclassified Variovorax TaxID=663243 RepID=UPI003F44DBE1